MVRARRPALSTSRSTKRTATPDATRYTASASTVIRTLARQVDPQPQCCADLRLITEADEAAAEIQVIDQHGGAGPVQVIAIKWTTHPDISAL